MKSINKLLGIGAIMLSSLNGCTKEYKIEGKDIIYSNKMKSMSILDSTEYKSYIAPFYQPNAFRSEHPKSEEIIFIYFEDKSGRYNLYKYNENDTALFNKKLKEFEYYQSKIDSIENEKKLGKYSLKN